MQQDLGPSAEQHHARQLSWSAWFQSCAEAICSSSHPDDDEAMPARSTDMGVSEKKYNHVPTQAANDFLRTATPRVMKKNNEIL